MGAFRSLILILFSFVVWNSSAAQDLPVIQLTDHVTSKQIQQVILRAENVEGPMTRENLLNRLNEFYSVADETHMKVATEYGYAVFLLEIENASDTFGEWVFTSRRHSVNRFAIYDITGPQPITLVDSLERSDNALNIKRYIGYGAVLKLAAGERRTLAVYADIEVLRAVPFEFYGFDAYLDEYYWQTSRFAFFLPTILVLIFVNLLFFAFLARPHFLYLAASEFSFLLVIMHSAAHLDAFGLAAFPIFAIQVSELTKCSFIIFMTMFAMNFLSSKTEHPRFHRILRALLAIGCLLFVFWLCAGWVSKDMRVSVRVWTWVYSAGGSLIFPVIGLLAVIRFGAHYIPLLIGWSAVAIVGLYLVLFILFPPLLGLPRFVTILSIIGWQEAIFVTLATVWKAWKDNQDQQRTVEAYARELEDRLEATLRARQLEEENALAASTIQDQNAMLQASGHDTRQVLLAINTATDFLDQGADKQNKELVDTLKASASYLDDILSTTLSATRTYSATRTCVALSVFPVEDLFRSLERIYRPAFSRKSLGFQVNAAPDLHLISDRALLTRAISNFIANSLQATTRGGLTLEAKEVAGNLELTIEDSGCGMAPELVEFLTASDIETKTAPSDLDRPTSGFKIARSIIDQLEGELRIETAVGDGTKITVVLPCALTDVTNVSAPEFEGSTGVILVDLDAGTDLAGPQPDQTIAMSFDDSSVMRKRASELVELMLYKPLCKEYADHPALSKLKPDQ